MNTIKLTYGLEEITSRIPGLFPYIEFDGNNVSTVHPASDSDSGCYGKIACSLVMPEGVFLDVEHEEINDEGQIVIVTQHVIIPCVSYSYKTLMGVYYKYRDDYPESTFILFMEKGIGKFKIEADIDFEHCTLVPEYEYYADCARLWNEYTKIGLMCDKYEQMKELTGEVNCDLECLLDKYDRMGGDVMRDYYGNLAAEVNDVAMYYYNCASDDFTLDFNLNITASENDLGILSTFMEFFGEKYVTALYAGVRDHVVKIVRIPNTGERSQDSMTADEKYYLDNTCIVEAVRGVDYFLPGDFVIYNDRTYVCEHPTINGEWDSDRFHLVSENYSDLTPDYDAYYNPPTGSDYKASLDGAADSQLNGFVGDLRYTDEGGNIQSPDEDTDWLWYYRIGRVGFSETVTDRFNNIEIIDGFSRVTAVGSDETHLMAYGDIITNITRDQEARTISLTYVIGAHLKAKLIYIDQDDDGNDHYYYGEYEFDSDDAHGIKHTEVYEYPSGGEIDEMDETTFVYFITHDKSEIDYSDTTTDPSIIVGCRYKKAMFSTHGHKEYADLCVNGDIVTFPYLVSDYTTPMQLEKDSLVNPVTKFDYLTGVAYEPTVDADVHISRGNAAAWERHAKLGELKTFDDLENYSNGGFFNLR